MTKRTICPATPGSPNEQKAVLDLLKLRESFWVELEVNLGQGGRRDPSEYITIKAEVFYDTSQRKNGVRPCVDQPYAQNMKIECAREIRNYPIGTKVQLDVVETEKEGSRSFLYSSYKWKHYIIEDK